MVNVLVTSCGSTPSQILCRNLVEDNRVSKLILVDAKEIRDCPTPHFFNLPDDNIFYYQVPSSNSKRYLQTIKGICEKEQIDLVIPTLPQDILLLFVPEFNVTTDITVTKDSLTFLDKRKTAEVFAEAGIPQPKFFPSRETIELPAIAKPRLGFAGVGQEVIASHEQEIKFFMDMGYLNNLVQEYIPDAKEYTTDVVCDKAGKILGQCTRERIATKGGLCTVAEVVYIPEITEWVKQICIKFKFYGQINIQCLKNKSGGYLFTEINPRCAGSAAISYAAGLPIAKLIIDAHLGIPRQETIQINQIKMLRYYSEVFI